MPKPLREKARNHPETDDASGQIVPLRPSAEGMRTELEPVVLRLRAQMALIQGYSSMLDSMSPAVQARIFGAIVKKTDELVQLLEPFRIPLAAPKPSLQEYRQTRMRTHKLLGEYRLLLVGMRKQVAATRRPGVSSPAPGP